MSTLLSCSPVLCKTTMYLCLRANHLPLVLNRTSKDKKRQHPRRNGKRAENAIELPQVSLRGADAFFCSCFTRRKIASAISSCETIFRDISISSPIRIDQFSA